MRQRLLIAVLLSVVSLPALAQTSPCAGGTINPLFTVIPSNSIQLKFEHSTTYTFTSPLVTITGNNITVQQFFTNIPPPPGLPSSLCNSQTVLLGTLAPGTYSVTWNYLVPSGIPSGPPQTVATYIFAFSVPPNVPALSGVALLGLMLLLASLGMVVLRR
ncbi:MAG: hypothetical protein QOK37_3276 [Thermoanaerobaculia bacterium]|jgi:hypothetical protein|nr:hypothetical protein [Thermoanaerobaculia bacterium]